MPAIQVRDFSDEAYAQIKAEAKANGRSITQQTKHIVMQYLEQRWRVDAEGAEDDGRVAGDALAMTFTDIQPPVQVKFQPADPYVPPRGSYPNPRRVEDEAVVAARVARRKAVFDRIASRNYPPSAYEIDPVQIVREMRDER